MRKLQLLLLVVNLFGFIGKTGFESELNVSLTESTVSWKGKKVGGEHFGKVSLINANLDYEKNRIKGGSFEIDMTSITCEDITNESSNKRLVEHLRSDDFFSVQNYPRATFVLTDAKTKNSKDYDMKGNLTIKGITKTVSFPAVISIVGDKVVADGKIVFDRAAFDIKYRSGSYFENLADKLIYDEVEMTVRLVADK
ncbi:YceI family protein [Anditalea andensis]|uniref:Lipid-binding protein n=1 Tax=Anditalea andensis TaxID=1048983 RepID=A0A074KU74_9BACT|nr:YceI family protein [Anditalea andensis]KEO73526.1 lipid-binding protein [Anditalea andensis]